ncbi:MAG: methyltransferase [Clostridiales bacterium]|jgi:uroporphyrinogen decarboxylase|nr:methyltransferase [Clostridiales bacterium]
MDSVERFYRTIERRETDRPACWLGLPDARALLGLFAHFRVSGMGGLKEKIGDDIFPVELPYSSPYSDAIYDAFDFRAAGTKSDASARTLTQDGFFSIDSKPSDVEKFSWPEPADYISPEKCRDRIGEVPNGKAAMGILWSAHFQDACSAYGMENAFIAMLENPEAYLALNDRIVDFYIRANRVFYENTAGRLHAVLIGNDMGSQRGLMLSREAILRFIMPGARRLIEQAHSYGVKVIYHSCGAVGDIIGDLIEAGADAIHPIQALADGMEPEGLKAKFGATASFCGGVDAQNLLVGGAPETVRDAVRRLRRIFPTGLIVSPSHEAILPDTPPANVEALFQAANEQAGA